MAHKMHLKIVIDPPGAGCIGGHFFSHIVSTYVTKTKTRYKITWGLVWVTKTAGLVHIVDILNLLCYRRENHAPKPNTG